MMQKLHRNLVVAVIAGLKDILLDKKQADSTVEQILTSNKTWGARDRHFIADNIYHIVRYKRLYEFCSDEEAWGEGAIWRIFATKWLTDGHELPEWEEFATLNKEAILKQFESAQSIPKIRESVPDWLDVLGLKELGKDWEKEITALNTPAKFCLRINTLKANKAVITKQLTDEGVEFAESEIAPDALIILSKKNFRSHPAYKNGLFEVQDIASQLVAPMLQVASGMKVIDGCAGAGGKALHLAALMKNQGEILAVDTHEKKLEELTRRANRAGCFIIQTLDASKLTHNYQARLQSFADRILLDVPCSGTGVLRRKPDAKWSLTEKFINELKNAQSQILDEYSPMLKPGGLLVYSTCSIFPSENQKQIQAFIKRSSISFELEEEKVISPAETGFDGFYIARLKRI
ncbi:MAG: class I SAM-dependent methyltransferase [Bacteroidetes bacterium]|nr:class I SAM-dependent methyltransferase [Bacteroidota bacterium]